MTPKEHAILLLSQGISTSQVAATLGVDDSYISQLKADPDVQAKIAEAAAARTVEDVRFDSKLEAAEMLALEKIEKNLPFANMGQALAAFKALNSARKRKDGPIGGDNVTNVQVNLTLPAHAIPQYVLNSKQEIVEVEGQTMVSATPKTLDSILAARAEGKALPKVTDIERAAALLENLHIPSPKTEKKVAIPLSPDIL